MIDNRISRRLGLICLICAGSLLLSSCGTLRRTSKKRKPKPAQKIPARLKNAKGKLIEQGIASWYGPQFNGKLTANGEDYNMLSLTAAHRTLPFNTLVRVKDLDNGRSVIVRINDRGPFAKNRIIDLSKKAAESLHMIGHGTAHVKLFLIKGNLQRSQTSHLAVATYTIQLGAFQDKEKAFERSRQIHGSRVQTVQDNNKTWFRVYYGLYINKSEAKRKLKQLAKKNIKGYIKQLENG